MHERRSRVAVVISVCLGTFLFSGCLPQLKGGLQVLTDDVPATVYLDGKLMEKTPYLNKDLKSADYMLEIRPDDVSYVPYQTKVTLKSGMLTVVNWKPGKRPETSGGVIFETESLRDKKMTELVITTIPDGGIIYVDGVARGFAPVTVQGLTKGEHQLEVRLPSYETQLQPINVLEGYRILVTAKLGKQEYQAPKPSSLATSSATLAATASASPSSSPNSSSTATTAATKKQTLPAPKVTIKSTNFFQNGKEVLRVRSDATASSRELGFATVGDDYKYLNERKEGWVKIQFGTQVGWIAQQFATVVE
jgi:hypothetical protein